MGAKGEMGSSIEYEIGVSYRELCKKAKPPTVLFLIPTYFHHFLLITSTEDSTSLRHPGFNITQHKDF